METGIWNFGQLLSRLLSSWREADQASLSSHMTTLRKMTSLSRSSGLSLTQTYWKDMKRRRQFGDLHHTRSFATRSCQNQIRSNLPHLPPCAVDFVGLCATPDLPAFRSSLQPWSSPCNVLDRCHGRSSEPRTLWDAGRIYAYDVYGCIRII
jgi:hypothetical protein